MNQHDKVQRQVMGYYHRVENMELNPVFAGLYGSQNYGLATEDSDVDVKIIIVPRFRDLVLGKNKISKTLNGENAEDQIDLKDISLMVENWKKQNINYLEILFSPYQVINTEFASEFEKLINRREDIARYDNYRFLDALLGMAKQKQDSLELESKEESEEYNLKNFLHLKRLALFLKYRLANRSFLESMISGSSLIELRYDPPRKIEMIKESREVIEEMKILVTNYKKGTRRQIDNENIEEFLNSFILDVSRKKYNIK